MCNISLHLPMPEPLSFDSTDTGTSVVRLDGVECFHRAVRRVLSDAISVHGTSTTDLTPGSSKRHVI